MFDSRLIQELRRRNVFRVGALYAASCWVVIGVLDIALPLVGAPEWLMRAAVLVALGGLPIALALSWFFEINPDPADSRPPDAVAPNKASGGRGIDFVVIGILGAALAVTLLGQFIMPSGPNALQSAGADSVHERSIAVLPTLARGAEQIDQYLLDGLTEELIFALSEQPELLVASSGSSFYFQDKDVTAKEVALRLQVRYVLESSMRSVG